MLRPLVGHPLDTLARTPIVNFPVALRLFVLLRNIKFQLRLLVARNSLLSFGMAKIEEKKHSIKYVQFEAVDQYSL